MNKYKTTVVCLILIALIPMVNAGWNESILHASDLQTLTAYYPESLNATFGYWESIKASSNVSAVIITGDLVDSYTNESQWANYTAARTLFTGLLLENPGNHDASSTYDFGRWDTHMGADKRSSGTRIVNATIGNDIIYIQTPYTYYNDTPTLAEWAAMQATINANPGKIPFIAQHFWFWMQNGTLYPVGNALLSNLSLPKGRGFVLSGHVVRNRSVFVSNGSFVQDQTDFQDANRSAFTQYTAHHDDNNVIDRIYEKTVWILPTLSTEQEHLIYAPDANVTRYYTNGTSDSTMYRGTHNSTLNYLKTTTGSALTNTTTSVKIGLQPDLTENTYYYLFKGAFVFPTAGTVGTNVVKAEFGVFRENNFDTNGDVGLAPVNFTPTGILRKEDYPNQFGSTILAPYINITTIDDGSLSHPTGTSFISTQRHETWDLDNSILKISSTSGDTGVGLVTEWDVSNSAPWNAPANTTYVTFFTSEIAQLNVQPYLDVWSTTAPSSSFTEDYTGGYAPLLVNFTDTSTNTPLYWAWYDNDTLISTSQNPQFIGFNTGNHPIKLNASNTAGGTNSSVTWINVTDAPALVLPVPDFSANNTIGYFPLTVQFTDLSQSNILGRNWTFGDGTNSTAANPIHTYTTSGTYTVSLEVVNISGYNTTVKPNYIGSTLVPVASFTKSRSIVIIPQSMTFNDTSTNNPTNWSWDFGDG